MNMIQELEMGKTFLMYKKAAQYLRKHPDRIVHLLVPKMKKLECEKRFKEINPDISQQELDRLHIYSILEI